ncbi:hypothetical protein [Reichenbachiella sp.]|uniref:hypothetical protein n=1 Tax=Reichenbachiella sp. TaxID=2184521 RepID=UPI003B5BA989
MASIFFRSKLLLFSFGLLLVTQHTIAQESISTERPTLSIGPWVLPENSFQWEQGAQYSDIKGNEWAYDAFIRASISKSTEIRFLIPTLESREVIAGLKWMMIKPQDGKLGVGFTMDVGIENDVLNLIGYRASFEKGLTDNLTGYFNVGYTSGGYFGDLTLAYAIGNKVTVTGEYWHHEDWKQLHTSFIYLINSETQIDLNGGYLLDAGNDYTFGLGISRRFKYNGSRNDG